MRAAGRWCSAAVVGGHCTRTPPRLQQHFTSLNGVNESVPELRHKLQLQLRQKMPRLQTVETENRLITQLARSGVADERGEALEMGEAMWAELHDPGTSIPFGSRTAMKITLCSSMRRCALVNKNRDVAEVWTARFAERAATISPADFAEDSAEAGRVRGWRETRAEARPGTGIDADDLEADAKEDAAVQGSGDGKTKAQKARKDPLPFDLYRREKLLEHPTVELAFRRRPGPGPRYTG
ncbi:hypothetical protein NESM_000084800 [Novymonas esmeraldas]|uniref:Uncharacterized protein n=1 Tax=Novymonas esmeraldas TaxID=1808958 RepID=A0AAW0F3V8_9TRYP